MLGFAGKAEHATPSLGAWGASIKLALPSLGAWGASIKLALPSSQAQKTLYTGFLFQWTKPRYWVSWLAEEAASLT
jgi:hypothetical protein